MNSFKKIKIIIPPYNSFYYHFNRQFRILPYGAGVLAEFLKMHQYEVACEDLSFKTSRNNDRNYLFRKKWINLNLLYRQNAIKEYAKGGKSTAEIRHFAKQIHDLSNCAPYHIVGISVSTYLQFLCAILLAAEIKSSSGTIVILGGPFITLYGDLFFQKFPVIDYMIKGDGQIPLLRLLHSLSGKDSLDTIPNLIYRNAGLMKVTRQQAFSIENIPVPDFEDIYEEHLSYAETWQPLFLPYQMSRGCSNHCCFCGRKAINPKMEFKSPDKVLSDLNMMKKRYKSNLIWFHDDAINGDYACIDTLCDILIKENLGILWMSDAKVGNLDRKLLRKMREAGCRKLIFGVESGCDMILKTVGKKNSTAAIADTLRSSAEEGIENGIYLMVGYPHETLNDLEHTISFIKENSLYLDECRCSNLLRIDMSSLMQQHPEHYHIRNLRLDFDMERIIEVGGCLTFAYDEDTALCWDKKLAQSRRYRRILLREVYRYIYSKKWLFRILPYWLFYLMFRKRESSYGTFILGSLEHLIAGILRILKKRGLKINPSEVMKY